MTETDPGSPCYHCGEPIPKGSDYPIRTAKVAQSACCRGCQAVAQTIIDSGNADYYRLRTDLPTTPEAALDEIKALALYDLPEVQEGFVKNEGAIKDASLILEGIVCAACIWLNERHLRQLPGVVSADINFSTRRARVRWDDSHIKLSQILESIRDIGYHAYPFDTGRQEELFRKERNTAIRRLAIAGLGMMQVMMYALPAYIAGDDGSMSPDIEALMRFASLLLTLPVVFYSAWPFFHGAWRDLRLYRVGMDVPVALGIGAAFAASVYGSFTGSQDVYYDSVVMFVFFLLTGRFLEMNARKRSAEAAETLVKLIPAVAVRLPDYPAARAEETIGAVRLSPGDFVLVATGAAFPSDARVVEGNSSVDESLLTGESRPIPKHPGSEVIGGSHNLGSPLICRVERTGQDTVVSSIVRLLDRALAEKPQLAQTADRIASHFVLALLIVAAGIATYWTVVDPSRAFWITVSVLVVSCPCALGLATPVTLTAALGHLTRLGLLSTRGHALEVLARATDFVFDKTGTLTDGLFRLRKTHSVRGDPDQALRLAAALEQGATHPIAAALREAALGAISDSVDALPLELPHAQHLEYHPGQGVEGEIDGQRYRLGAPEFAAPGETGSLPEGLAGLEGLTLIALSDTQGVLAWFALGDGLRPQCAELVAQLKGLGVRLHLYSGDRPANVAALARQLGISNAHGGMRPQDKLEAVRALQAAGAIVAMTGDGVNDAPVLAQAQVSIAVDQGAEAAQAAADMILLSSELVRIADGVRIARKAQRIIRQNLTWAVLYNALAIPAAAMGLVTPWMAGIGMSASSLLVVLNALRLSSPSIQHTTQHTNQHTT